MVIALLGTPVGVGAAVAQAPQPPASASLPSDTELDALLTARNWNAISAAISAAKAPDSLMQAMNWLSTRLKAGGGSLLGFLYAPRLWGFGSGLQIENPTKDARVTAGLIVLYTYQLIVIDGAKCADRTAPGNRLSQLLTQNREVLEYLRSKPNGLKALVIVLAMDFENRTAPLRKDDDLLCRGGMEEMQAGIAAGTARDLTGKTNHPGRTIGVEARPVWTPRMLAPATYQPIQERARAEMEARLLKLVQ